MSARQMLVWLDGRNGSSFGSIAWGGNTLSFTITAGANWLTAMTPVNSVGGSLTGITRDGVPVPYTTETIKGVRHAFFSAAAGSYQASYGGL